MSSVYIVANFSNFLYVKVQQIIVCLNITYQTQKTTVLQSIVERIKSGVKRDPRRIISS